MSSNSRGIEFLEEARIPRMALVLVCDLEGFSKFFNLPDVQSYIPLYLNEVFKCLSITIQGGTAYWMEDKKDFTPLLQAAHVKFLGDGALYVWLPPEGEVSFDQNLLIKLMNRLWFMKSYFFKINERASEVVPIPGLPQKIRFGLAMGNIFELQHANGRSNEYVGMCVNLASRLQSYCPSLGIVASARLGISAGLLEKNNYIKVVARNLKGFPREYVCVEKDEFMGMDRMTRNNLFEMA